MELIAHLVVALVMLLLIGVGIVLGLVVLATFAGITGVGVVSSSVIVGFWKRRTLAGVHAFFLQCGVLAGAPAGAVLTYLMWHLWPAMDGAGQVLAAGAVGGALGGLAIAGLASTAAKNISEHAWPWLKARVTVFQRLEA
jgi:hypothetical protein